MGYSLFKDEWDNLDRQTVVVCSGFAGRKLNQNKMTASVSM